MSFGLKLFDILTANATAAKSYINRMLAKKQDKLTFDSAPTAGSSNPVTSDGIRKAIDTATPNVDFSNYPTKNGTGATGTWPISISGAATKASQDSNGRVIADTYLKKAGDTATGDITAPNFIGHLKGNADTATACSGNSATATKLQAARTINFNGALDGKMTFDGSNDVSVTLSEFNHTEAIIDLTDATKYDTDTYYPVVSDAYWGDAEHKYRCWTPIHAVKTASWGTIGTGDYNAELKVRNNMDGWGARAAYAEILMNSCIGTNGKMPITYSQMVHCGRSVFFVRGGGKYWFSSTRNATWELKADTFTENGDTVAQTNTYFTPESKNTIKTVGINISGNAATATTATTATKANGLTGSLNFPDIGDVATSNKISWNGSTDGADIYYQTTASDQRNLVLNLRDDANCYLRIAYNGAFKSYFTPADGNFHGNVNGKSDSAGSADTSAAINYSNIGTNYIKAGSADTGDAANQTANMVIGSWYGITFYDVCGNKIAGGMNVRDGSLTMKGTITGSKVYNAVYNDYAEFFEKDEDTAFEAGDIVALDTNSEEERYIKATEDSIVVVGVCTHEYAHIIGGKGQTIEENEKEFVPISLMGRVHVKVDDTVKRGDKVTASKVPGIGRKAMPGEHSIGTALTNPSNGKVRVLINL